MKTVEILLIEDNPGDIRLTQEWLKEAKVANTLHVAKNGLEAIEFLKKQGQFEGVPTPDLVLLDLNLPHKNGREVLKEMKSDEEWKGIPVVVLTTSDAHRDIELSYDLQANCFITKPMDVTQFHKVVQDIEHFWLALVRLPSESSVQLKSNY